MADQLKSIASLLTTVSSDLANVDIALTALNAKLAVWSSPTAIIPDGGTFVQGVSAVITTTTAVEVIAAPAASNHLVIQRVYALNFTAAEIAALMLIDATPTDLACLFVGDPAIAGQGVGLIEFPGGLVCASAKAFQAKGLIAAKGDIHVYAEGYSIAD